jgi:hypothetical protein
MFSLYFYSYTILSDSLSLSLSLRLQTVKSSVWLVATVVLI